MEDQYTINLPHFVETIAGLLEEGKWYKEGCSLKREKMGQYPLISIHLNASQSGFRGYAFTYVDYKGSPEYILLGTSLCDLVDAKLRTL